MRKIELRKSNTFLKNCLRIFLSQSGSISHIIFFDKLLGFKIVKKNASLIKLRRKKLLYSTYYVIWLNSRMFVRRVCPSYIFLTLLHFLIISFHLCWHSIVLCILYIYIYFLNLLWDHVYRLLRSYRITYLRSGKMQKYELFSKKVYRGSEYIMDDSKVKFIFKDMEMNSILITIKIYNVTYKMDLCFSNNTYFI